MRRGTPTGRGGNASRGPLLTDHLQGLQDIDLELALLKRKRQLMEEQQHLLKDNEQYHIPRNDYEQSYNRRYNPNRDFSNLYDDSRESCAGRKRQAIAVWEDEVPPKRFSGPNRGNVRKSFGSRLGPEPTPRFESSIHKTQLNHQGFNPAWNQSASSARQRSRGINKKPQPLMSQKFKPNLKPSPSGPKPAKDFKRSKVTNPKNSTAAVGTFRNLYATPLATNVDVVSNSTVLCADEKPTRQMTGRLELALGRVMKEIKEAYETRYFDIFVSLQYQRLMKQAIRNRIKTVMLGKNVGSADDILKEYRQTFPSESDKDIVNEALTAKQGQILMMTPVDTDDPTAYFKFNMNRLLDIKLNEMFTKLENIYRAEYNTPEESTPAEVSESHSNESVNESNDFTNNVVIDETEKDGDISVAPVPITYKSIEKIITQKVPFVLKKYIPFIIKQMELDVMFEATKASIKTETLNKLSKGEKTDEPKSNVVENTENVKLAKLPVALNLPYYVKVLGRPYLPRKTATQQFLYQFNPKSIKKHKNMNNLLFVGFDNKEDFDKILAATDTTIGRFKLEIKISERATEKSDKPEEGDTKSDTPMMTEDMKIQMEDKLLSPELDNQITDLLSAIRKADEEEKTQNESLETDTILEHSKNDNEDLTKTETGEATEETAQTETEITEVVNQENTPTQYCDKTPENEEIAEVNADEPKEKTEHVEDEKEDNQESAQTSVMDNGVKLETVGETNEDEEMKDEGVEALKSEVKVSGRATPTRTSSRLAAATPSTIRTRRTSRLVQNNS